MDTRRGRLFVIAAPSGAGKTSLVKALLGLKPQLALSISHTTRPKRATEEHGREYYFVDRPEEFRELVARGEFLEHAQVFDNLYGTARGPVDAQLAEGKDVILEIDWQGARQVRAAMPQATTVFILPPSRAALEERLRNRRTDSSDVIQRRLHEAVGDMSHWDEFDYVVVNDDFNKAASDLAHIVEGRADELRTSRKALQPLLADLLA